jgi:hypothetical protein
VLNVTNSRTSKKMLNIFNKSDIASAVVLTDGKIVIFND